MHPKDADGMANSVDPDQTASSEAVWSWSALFAETYLSQYIEFVRYIIYSNAHIATYRVNDHVFMFVISFDIVMRKSQHNIWISFYVSASFEMNHWEWIIMNTLKVGSCHNNDRSVQFSFLFFSV